MDHLSKCSVAISNFYILWTCKSTRLGCSSVTQAANLGCGFRNPDWCSWRVQSIWLRQEHRNPTADQGSGGPRLWKGEQFVQFYPILCWSSTWKDTKFNIIVLTDGVSSLSALLGMNSMKFPGLSARIWKLFISNYYLPKFWQVCSFVGLFVCLFIQMVGLECFSTLASSQWHRIFRWKRSSYYAWLGARN